MGAAGASEREADRSDERHETSEQHQLSSRTGHLTREEQRQEDHGGEVGEGSGADHELTERRGALARILEHRHDEPQGGRKQDDGDEDR